MSAPIGIVGLGNMGMPVAKTTLRAGLPVLAYDLRDTALDEIERSGARRASALGELAACDSVALLLLDDAQVLAVAEELVAVLSPGSTLVIHSTVRPATVHEVAQQAREGGIDVIDAPVSGGSFNAERGDLTLMVGGPSEVVDRLRPQLDPLGTIHHIGPLGAGVAMKLANNLMQNGHWMLLCHAFEIAASLGIPERRVREIVLESSGASWSLEHIDHLDRLVERHTSADDLRVFAKDSHAAMVVAHDADLRVPLAALVQELLPRVLARRRQQVHG